MADFEKAYNAVMEHEGNNHRQEQENTKILLCSDCFRDEGLKIDASVLAKLRDVVPLPKNLIMNNIVMCWNKVLRVLYGEKD